jgi:2',3'-cyclic-nucleotide 2'-phosphodiesterase (5'-nucleotidase family)
VEGYAAQVRPVLERVVGQASADILNEKGEQSLDSPLGDLIADMLRAEAGTDLAFYNRGGVRGFLPAGPVKVAQLHEMFPFDDNVMVLEASGRQIQELVAQGTAAQPRLSPSGLTAVVEGEKVRISTPEGPLDPDRIYTVATTNFLATGGDNMTLFPALPVKNMLPYTREVVQSYLEKHGALTPPAAGRVLTK